MPRHPHRYFDPETGEFELTCFRREGRATFEVRLKQGMTPAEVATLVPLRNSSFAGGWVELAVDVFGVFHARNEASLHFRSERLCSLLLRRLDLGDCSLSFLRLRLHLEGLLGHPQELLHDGWLGRRKAKIGDHANTCVWKPPWGTVTLATNQKWLEPELHIQWD